MKQFQLIILLLIALIGSLQNVAAVETDFVLGAEKHLRVPVTINDQGPFDFILDTAASRTVITQPLVNILRLVPIVNDERTIVHGATGAIRIERYASLQLDFNGQFSWKTGIIPALTMPTEGKPFYGILGSDFFQANEKIEIDVMAGKLRLGQSIQTSNTDSIMSTPIYEITDGIWGFDVKINNTKVTALLDTGARRSIANSLALPGITKTTDSVRIEGASGHKLEGFAATGLNITVKNFNWLDRTIEIADLHVFNQLGIADKPAMIFAADLLFEYTLVVDYGDQQMWLKARSEI